MTKRAVNSPLKSWAKPELRRLETGGAALAGDTSVDGSALLS